MTEKVPGWLERILLPRLSEIAGDIKAVYAKIEGLDKKIDAVDEKLSTKIDEMDERLSNNDRHLAEKIDDLDKRLDMAQRLAILETKMGELQPKA